MKTLAKLLYVEADEEITDLVDRLRDLSLEDEVTFVVPERARALQSAMSFRLLKRYADSYGKRVNLVSGDPRLQAMALDGGFTAYPSMEAYDRGTQVHQPEPVDSVAATSAAKPVMAQMASPVSTPTRGVATLDRPGQAPLTSAPPRRATTAPKPASSAPSFRSYRPYLIAAGILVVLGLLAGVLYLPSASATLLVSGTPIKEDITLRGAVGNPNSGDQFATKTISESESQTLPGVPTGQKQIAAVPASGTVTFSLNCFLCTETIPKGWTVETADGSRKYATQRSVTLIGPSSAASVPIIATTGGGAGNVDKNTIVKIDGNTDDNLGVTNPDPTAGGVDARTATIIQQSDIDAIRDAYAKDAVPRVQDQMNSKAQGLKLVVVGGAPQVAVTTDKKVGDEVGGFSVTLKVTGDGIAFDDKTVKALLRSAMERKIPQGNQLTNNVNLSYEPIDAAADGHVTLNGHASGFYIPIFLDSKLRSYLRGMSPGKAHALLQSQPNVVDARITQTPFGLPWLPLFTSHINLKVQEVDSPSSS
ncbi:MAG TPA: baseplate J/gp47 family protein [Candidatus Dormibacteraeota bacterium]|nr:baseplate J/gp47 family protein [Candidatus Dormibacteraeota bacterium]